MHPSRIGPLSRNGYEIADEVEENRDPRGTTRGDRWRHALLTWAVFLQWASAFILVVGGATAAFALVAGYSTRHVPMVLATNGTIFLACTLASWSLKRNWWWAE